MDRPFVFIGSSSEKEEVARAIQANLERHCEAQVWSQGVFDGSLTPVFQALVGELRRYDFAIIVLAADDVVVSRGVTSAMPRDNLLFELGLFIGALGADRTVAVVDRSIAAKLPSDLLGIHPLSYEPPKQGNWQSALGTACDRIAQKLQKLPARPEEPEMLRRLRAHWQRHAELYPDSPNPDRFKLYSFFGLCDEDEGALQEPDVEHVYHLWADAAAGSTIAAAVRRDDGPPRFRVRFDNQDSGHAGNVAFRIDGRNLLCRADGFRTLRFQARLPADLEAADLREVQLGIRLVDALGTHWIHALREGYRPLFVTHADGAPWADCAVDLADRRTTSWKVFEQDGNSLYHGDIPDFTMLLAVVVEVGRRQAIRPGPGRGVVELRSFRVE